LEFSNITSNTATINTNIIEIEKVFSIINKKNFFLQLPVNSINYSLNYLFYFFQKTNQIFYMYILLHEAYIFLSKKNPITMNIANINQTAKTEKIVSKYVMDTRNSKYRNYYETVNQNINYTNIEVYIKGLYKKK